MGIVLLLGGLVLGCYRNGEAGEGECLAFGAQGRIFALP